MTKRNAVFLLFGLAMIAIIAAVLIRSPQPAHAASQKLRTTTAHHNGIVAAGLWTRIGWPNGHTVPKIVKVALPGQLPHNYVPEHLGVPESAELGAQGLVIFENTPSRHLSNARFDLYEIERAHDDNELAPPAPLVLERTGPTMYVALQHPRGWEKVPPCRYGPPCWRVVVAKQ